MKSDTTPKPLAYPRRKITPLSSHAPTRPKPPNAPTPIRPPVLKFSEGVNRHDVQSVLKAYEIVLSHDRESLASTAPFTGVRFERPPESFPPSRQSRIGIPEKIRSVKARLNLPLTPEEQFYQNTRTSFESYEIETALKAEIRTKAQAKAKTTRNIASQFDAEVIPFTIAQCENLIDIFGTESMRRPSTHSFGFGAKYIPNNAPANAIQRQEWTRGRATFGVMSPCPSIYARHAIVEIPDWHRLIKRNRSGNIVLISHDELRRDILGTLTSPIPTTSKTRESFLPVPFGQWLESCESWIAEGKEGLPPRTQTLTNRQAATLQGTEDTRTEWTRQKIGKRHDLIRLWNALSLVSESTHTPPEWNLDWMHGHDYTIRSTGYKIPPHVFLNKELLALESEAKASQSLPHRHQRKTLARSKRIALAKGRAKQRFANELLNGILLKWSHGVVQRRPNPRHNRQAVAQAKAESNPSQNIFDYIRKHEASLKTGTFPETTANDATTLPMEPNYRVIVERPLVRNLTNPLFPVLHRPLLPLTLATNQGIRNNFGRDGDTSRNTIPDVETRRKHGPERQIPRTLTDSPALRTIPHPSEPTPAERNALIPSESARRNTPTLIESHTLYDSHNPATESVQPYATDSTYTRPRVKQWHDGYEHTRIVSRKVTISRMGEARERLATLAQSRRILAEHREDIAKMRGTIPTGKAAAKVKRYTLVPNDAPNMIPDENPRFKAVLDARTTHGVHRHATRRKGTLTLK